LLTILQIHLSTGHNHVYYSFQLLCAKVPNELNDLDSRDKRFDHF